ncbi:cobalamin biosynthesis protein CobD [Cohnella xylanilytica]|uniref:Cobalamin biosynthesis protein CobD n=1 Tax=Cohnella xylanilytica TaxID=557555 RepID=A0A841U8B4_9BACL|nr:adenosylcobinamide-phosphate synthase CbiB [Cohnella xylanilytica]MBB6694503.1 cobalamin biosynthesis protein CobD [Cohnella xylanilytica]
MIFYSVKDTVLMVLLAVVVDWLVGDPARIPHPVVWIGKLISRLERVLLRPGDGARRKRLAGVVLALAVTLISFGAMWGIAALATWVHPWLGFAANVWFVSTTFAVKGLKQAAMRVYEPLVRGDLKEAREKVGWIVGRDTHSLDEKEVSRAAVETVAENTVDAFVSPLAFALLGAAPLAMLYRAANTLDSMVGYRNEKYRFFGWASARLDDVLNWLPARATGWLLALAAAAGASGAGRASGMGRAGLASWSGRAGWAGLRASAGARRAVRKFARLHPSPNSGIPESAVAGALGIELGGTNRYGDVVSERARMGWPLRPLEAGDIVRAVRLLYGVSYIIAGGLLCVWCSLAFGTG